MPNPHYVLLYVDNPQASGDFYTGLLDRAPVESSATFVLFVLDNGVKFGLWSRHTVEPKAITAGGGAEIGFPVERSTVDPTFADWKRRGIAMLQQPTDMDFGRSFVGLDPDGHRLRVFALAENPV